MLKKHLFLLFIMVMALASANATTFKRHNAYVEKKMQNIFDTGDKVYYLNSGFLFQFDKATSSTTALHRQNVLSDNRISNIYYDWENRLLFVAYVNSNIDVIDSSGKVTNISNIKDKVVAVHGYSLSNGEPNTYVGKAINDINFGNGKAYVATGYGFVIIDEETLRVVKNHEVRQTITVNTVCPMGDLLLFFSNNYCYYGDPNDSDPSNNFQRVSGSFGDCKSYPLNDHSVFLFGSSSGLHRYDFSSGTPTLTNLLTVKISNVQKTPTGFIANFTSDVTTTSYYTVNADGTSTSKQLSVIVRASSDPLGDGTVWVTDANGLHINGNTTYYKMNSLTTDAPYWLKYNATMDKLYAGISGPVVDIYGASQMTVANVINTYDGVNWADATAYTAAGGGYEFVFNPTDPHTYMRAGWSNKGIFKITNDVRKLTYTASNSPIGLVKPHPAFDNYGNLWVISQIPDTFPTPCVVLPKNKVANNSVSKSDWFVLNRLKSIISGKAQNSRFIVASKNNVKIYSDCDYAPQKAIQGHIFCWDNGSEDPTVDNYMLANIASFIDQNNGQIKWEYLRHFEEDKNGMIWVGHTTGIFAFDPDVVFDELPRAYRPIVIKSNERKKTYLCEGYSVYDIGVDRNNNKWIATDNGLYFVSPDGSELFNHYTTENSDILSNNVYSVECDTVHDRVYIYTDNGFAEYIPQGDAAAINFDNVYAFPNPVEPDFTGMIKIAGLMDNSFVTVTDRNNNVVASFGPVMGSAFWDGSGADGERVSTGIYNIYVAQGAQPAINGTPHTTVMIIK